MTLRRVGRLPDFTYVGPLRYSLTLCTFERAAHFTHAANVERVGQQLLETAVVEEFDAVAYCFMPDHLHVLAEGRTETSDLIRLVCRFKQQSGFWFSKERQTRLWQTGYYDHILRDNETTLVVARYILENPVRAGLVERFSEYPFSGSSLYSLEDLAEGCADNLSPRSHG